MAPVASSSKSSKASSSKPKSAAGQSTLGKFGFKGGSSTNKTKAKAAQTTTEDEEPDEEEEEEEDEEMEAGNTTTSAKKKKTGRPDQSDLPPLTDIPSIFADLVNRIPDFVAFANAFKGRKLRVATMCSGTESPLLALGLITRALKKDHGVDLHFEHVFSCEIVPWKQAYIERNFKPPLLFRDVTELGNEEATTAYGAKITVPIDVDMLIAGTSCVDYSTLNNQKQEFEAKGESGETFRGMMRWVQRAQPTIVILENVCGAPWPKVAKDVEKAGYSASFSRFDTKNYYIPHTRMRVYLFAVREQGSRGERKAQKWLETVKGLQRPCSAPYDAFLLAADDPRIQIGRERLVKGDSSRAKTVVEWAKCEARHARARLEEQLGNRRPLTNWSENGTCKMQDFAWIDWASAQVDRVWDLMDISFMRAASKGYDSTYKSILWNLSQNVDRQIGSSVPGISPCMTPTMIPYLNFRGGPMLGVEALGLQGLPVDELVLTRETEDNLSDLAGNAMSSTVVGTAMVAALYLCGELLCKDVPKDPDADMAIDQDENKIPGEDLVSGFDQLAITNLDLAKLRDVSLKELLEKAQASARLCACEGRSLVTTTELTRCQDCGHTACTRCGGRPEHNYTVIDVESNPRIRPLAFQKEAKEILPMRVELVGVSKEKLEALKKSAGIDIKHSVWESYKRAVSKATSLELHYHALKRQSIWVAVYDSPVAFLELNLDPKNPEWRLYAKPDPSEPIVGDSRS